MKTGWEVPRLGEVQPADGVVSDDALLFERARAFAEPLLTGQQLDTGESALAHAQGVAAILRAIGAAPSMGAAAYLVYAGDYLNKPEDVVAKAFGTAQASLVAATRKLVRIQRSARGAQTEGGTHAGQVERVRKMLLAFSRDLRVVLLRLASRLQTLRWHAAVKRGCPPALARESLQVFAPLAHRLGIGQVKWELEDLSFRFLQPDDYRAVAALLDETRVARETQVESFRSRLAEALRAAGIDAEVAGRPKHLYSIWKKMQGKGVAFDRVYDVRAVRVIVASIADCYAVLDRVHSLFVPIEAEFDDYIARPKPNGYRSLHTVVAGDDSRVVEVQIRTGEMHQHAEYGVAAHWAYKEAGVKGYGGSTVSSASDAAANEARKAVLRQLLAWEHELAVQEQSASAAPAADAPADDRIYVFTPQADVIELPAGATPIDLAYAVHTDLGHRCRGAKIDGAMAPLNTMLQSGQTVEISAARDGGPSLDWLNPELGYLRAQRSRTKVRAWFNAQVQAQTIGRGREAVEKLLQREGRTALKLSELAARLGFRHADALFDAVAKDEFSLRTIEGLLRPAPPPKPGGDAVVPRKSAGRAGEPKGVLVVGMGSLLTHLAHCCRPAPPDRVTGYVTRGKGVAVHRDDCSNLRQMGLRTPQRLIPVAWSAAADAEGAGVYPVDLIVESADRQGLLRDITDVLVKQKINVVGVNTRSLRDAHGGTAWMTFTVEVANATHLAAALKLLLRVDGVRGARRR